MDKFIKTDTGGLPLRLDDLIWEQGELDASNFGIYQALQAELLAYGTDYIVEGCVYSAPNITAGWIMLGSELLRVDAHAGTDDFFAKVSTFDARGDKTFKDASSQSTYQVNRGVLNAASGTLDITSAERLKDKVIQLLATSAESFAVANIPSLPASKITSGTFDAARIPSLAASIITSDTFDAARIPTATETAVGGAEFSTQAEVDAGTDNTTMITPNKLRSTIFASAQIPNLSAGTITSGTFSAARIPQATETAVGGAEIATTAESIALTDDTKMITPAKLSDVNGGLLTKVINIGDWNMDTDASVAVAHGLTFSKIRQATAMIIDDTSAVLSPIDFVDAASPGGGVNIINSSAINLFRYTSGPYDNTGYDSTSFNRGYIIIKHLP